MYCKAAAASVSVMKPRVILYHVGLGEQGNPFGVCNPTAVPVFRGAAGLEFVIPGNPTSCLRHSEITVPVNSANKDGALAH